MTIKQNEWKCRNMWGTFEWRRETQGVRFFLHGNALDLTKYNDIDEIRENIAHYERINRGGGLFPPDTDTVLAEKVYRWMEQHYKEMIE